jgi:hypothetical protein
MANLFDELQNGTVSRRKLFELFPIAAGSAALASAQTGKQAKQTKGGAQGSSAAAPKMSPANIGGGGRIERDYYREWIKTSKVPMVDGYSLLDASKQELQPLPDTGGRGLYLMRCYMTWVQFNQRGNGVVMCKKRQGPCAK